MQTTSITRFYSLSFLLRREGPKLWSAQCLEFGVVSCGVDHKHASNMLAEAVGMVLADDLLRGRDPFARRSSAEEDRQTYRHAISHGNRGSSIDDVPRGTTLIAMPVSFDVSINIEGARNQVISTPIDAMPDVWKCESTATFAEAA